MECAAAPPNKDSTSARVEIDVGGSSRCLTNSWHACCVHNAATCCVTFHNAATCCVAQRCDATHNAATCCVLPGVPDQQLWAIASERAVGSLRAAAAVRCEWRSVAAQRHCAHRMCTLMMIGGALRGACCVPCAAWHKCCGMQRRTAEPSAGRPRGSAGLAAQRQSPCCSLSPRTAPSPSRRCSPGLRSRVGHRHQAQPCRICTGTGPTLATSAPGPGSALPPLPGITPAAATSAIGPPGRTFQHRLATGRPRTQWRREGRSGGTDDALEHLAQLPAEAGAGERSSGADVAGQTAALCAQLHVAWYMLCVASCYCILQGARCVRHIARCAIACMPHF
jgi:hypothetical protein